MNIIADSGSTKSEFVIVNGGGIVDRALFAGINPVHQGKDDIAAILGEVSAWLHRSADDFRGRRPSLMFYGAGCAGVYRDMMRTMLAGASGIDESDVDVDSDMTGALLALFGRDRGIACILGTGSNSCLCDGGRAVSGIRPLGYILGDEGSGAVLGKMFLNALYKGRLQTGTGERFAAWSHLTYDDVIRRVYREPAPNRFLASLSPFIAGNIGDDNALREVVKDNFRLFFRNNVARYDLSPLPPIGFVGSIAWYYRDVLCEVAAEEGFTVNRILRSPLDGLVKFVQ